MQRIYLDANATTPALPEAVAAMLPWLGERVGNPSAAHRAGQAARAAVERARAQVAALLNASAKEIVFTSGGTESDHLALFGVIGAVREAETELRPHLVTTAIEHHAVLHAVEELAKRGSDVTFVAPNADGVVAAEVVAAALRPETRLVSVMLANNETGAVQPVGKIARLVREYAAARGTRIAVHTDAVQGAGKLPLDMAGAFRNVDLLSISGHKVYAPQGTGALFVRGGTKLRATTFGGPQERMRRAGTENVAGIVGFGVAAEAAAEWLTGGGAARLAEVRDEFVARVLGAVPGSAVNAAGAARVPNTVNLRFDGVDAGSLVMALDMAGVAASFGAACMSGVTEPSHVLLAAGLSARVAKSSVRFSMTRSASRDEMMRAADVTVDAVRRLRAVA